MHLCSTQAHVVPKCIDLFGGSVFDAEANEVCASSWDLQMWLMQSSR